LRSAGAVGGSSTLSLALMLQDDIAHAIEALMLDDRRRARMGRAARFTPDAVAKRVEVMVVEWAG
jgi:hypothetical protein